MDLHIFYFVAFCVGVRRLISLETAERTAYRWRFLVRAFRVGLLETGGPGSPRWCQIPGTAALLSYRELHPCGADLLKVLRQPRR